MWTLTFVQTWGIVTYQVALFREEQVNVAKEYQVSTQKKCLVQQYGHGIVNKLWIDLIVHPIQTEKAW